MLFLTILPIDWTFDPKWKYHSSIKYSYGNISPFNDLLLGRSGSVKEVTLNIIMTIPFGFIYSFYNNDINHTVYLPSSLTNVGSLAFSNDSATTFYINHLSIPETFNNSWVNNNAKKYILDGDGGYKCVKNCS